MAGEGPLIPAERIERAVLLFRGQKVLLDWDLAELYGVPTKVLNQAIRRNLNRFPANFMFQLSQEELAQWRSQVVTSNPAAQMELRRPYAFTEQGVAMLSSVLHSKRAISVNIAILRTFVRFREMLATLERKYDTQFRVVFSESTIASATQGTWKSWSVADTEAMVLQTITSSGSRT